MIARCHLRGQMQRLRSIPTPSSMILNFRAAQAERRASARRSPVMLEGGDTHLLGGPGLDDGTEASWCAAERRGVL